VAGYSGGMAGYSGGVVGYSGGVAGYSWGGGRVQVLGRINQSIAL
jgi:hypothetical protein